MQLPQDESAYETRAVVGGRTIRVGLTGKTYGEVKPSYWPDPGFDDTSGTPIGSASKAPVPPYVNAQVNRVIIPWNTWATTRIRSIVPLQNSAIFTTPANGSMIQVGRTARIKARIQLWMPAFKKQFQTLQRLRTPTPVSVEVTRCALVGRNSPDSIMIKVISTRQSSRRRFARDFFHRSYALHTRASEHQYGQPGCSACVGGGHYNDKSNLFEFVIRKQ